MHYFVVAGLVALVAGLLFIFAPERLRSINEVSSRLVSSIDMQAFKYRTGLGLALLISSLLFFFVAYYIVVKG